jgi:hypothetical protein
MWVVVPAPGRRAGSGHRSTDGGGRSGMAVLGFAVTLVILGGWLYSIMDVLATPADEVRTMSKLLWIVVLVLFGLVGSVAWFVLGRPRAAHGPGPGRAAPGHPAFGDRGSSGLAGAGKAGGSPPGLAPRARMRRGRTRPLGPDDDPEFLRALSERIRGGDADGPSRD